MYLNVEPKTSPKSEMSNLYLYISQNTKIISLNLSGNIYFKYFTIYSAKIGEIITTSNPNMKVALKSIKSAITV